MSIVRSSPATKAILEETDCPVLWETAVQWVLLVCLVFLVLEVLRVDRVLMVWSAIPVFLVIRENRENPEKMVMVSRAPKANLVTWALLDRRAVKALVVGFSIALLLVQSTKKVSPDTVGPRVIQVQPDLMDKPVLRAQRASRDWLASVDPAVIVDLEAPLACQVTWVCPARGDRTDERAHLDQWAFLVNLESPEIPATPE